MDNNSPGLYDKLKTVSISGVKWSGVAELMTRLFQFIVTIVLTRILDPVDFGLITLALIIVLMMQLVIDFGLSSAMIQKKEITEIQLHSSFHTLLVFSIISAIFVYFFSHSISLILGNPNSGILIKSLSVLIVFTSLGMVPRVILMRNLDFKKIAVIETISKFIYGIVTLTSVLILKNLWCFIIGIYSEQLVLLVLFWIYSHWKPRLQFSKGGMKELFSFSSIVFGTRALNFTNLNILNVLINRFYGSVTLGYFSLCYQIIELPTQRIAKMIMKVMYPVLSKLQDDMIEFRKLFMNYIFMIVLITLPIYLTLNLAAKPFILTFFGSKWINAVPILKILCLLGFLRCIWTGISVITMALNKPKYEFIFNLILSSLLIPGLFIFSSKGLIFILLYFIFLLSLLTLYGYYSVTKWLMVPVSLFIKKYKVPVIAGLGAFFIVFFTHQFSPENISSNNLVYLFIISGLSIGFYLLIVTVLDRTIFKMIFKMMMNR